MGHESQMRSLHSYMRFLPTKTDFEQYVKRIEKTYRQEITELKKDLGVRMEDIEYTADGLCTALQSREETLNSHTVYYSSSCIGRMILKIGIDGPTLESEAFLKQWIIKTWQGL